MNDIHRISRSVAVGAGRQNVPEPHQSDYSSDIPEEIFTLIDDFCPQADIGVGEKVKRFQW